MSRTWPAALAFAASCAVLAAGLLRGPSAPGSPATSPEDDAAVHAWLCSQCHPLASPRSYGKDEWPGKVDEMRRLSRERGLEWTEEQHAAVLRHFRRHGR